MTHYQRGLLTLALQAVLADFELDKNRGNRHFYTCIQIQTKFTQMVAESIETLSHDEAAELVKDVIGILIKDWCRVVGIPHDSNSFITSFVTELQSNKLIPHTMEQAMITSMRTAWLRYLIERVPNYPCTN